MKELKGWDQYVAEATETEDTSIKLPLFDGEVYVIDYPTRAQGKKLAAAESVGDTDALVIALLGEDAGKRVIELSQDYPATVLDRFILDVLRAFGFVPEEEKDGTTRVAKAKTTKAAAGKSTAATRRTRATKRTTGSSRSSAA